MGRKRYMIIGDGAAGLTAAEELRRRDGDAAIGLFCDDPNPGYFRAALTNFLLGELREDQLWAVPPDFYGKRGIERVFTRVLRVDPAAQKVWCSGNPVPLGFDALLVATGARARPPTFAGSHLPGVLTLRTIQDARRVVDTLRANVKRAVVLGGGPLGLEWTHSLLERGVQVTLLERAPRFMPRALDAVASDLLAARLRKAGVEIVLGEEVTRVDPGPHGGVASVMTNTGRRIACDLVASALGIVPNSELLESSGIAREPNGAVKVDKRLQSSAPLIWAAGDVASVEGEQLGLWEPARHQGRVAAANMAGAEEQYRPGAHYLATRLFDLDFARIGEIEDAPDCTALVDFPRGTGHIAYRKLSLKDGKVRGALLIGERQAKVRAIGRGLKRLIDAGADVSNVAQRLLEPGFDVSGFLETRKLVARPDVKRTELRAAAAPGGAAPGGAAAAFSAAPVLPAVSAAKLRGTQAISLSTLAIPSGAFPAQPGTHSTSQMPQRTSQLPAAAPGTSQLPQRTSLIPVSEPRRTKMLSIGFHAEAPPEPVVSEQPIEARFELAGQVLPIVGKLCSIGSGPDCGVRLSDPQAAFLHAQIAQQGRELYLRDAGTQTGTWVNGAPLAGAHSLRDGDRVLVGRTELVFRSSMLAPSTAAADAVIALPRLELRSGPSMGLSFVLAAEHCSIGSGAGVDFQIFDPSIAPLHARVRAVQGAHYLSDQNSPSGSFARGNRLAPGQEVPLADGEAFQLGAITLAYSRAPTRDRVAAFRPMARLSVTSGPNAGISASFAERLILGSAADAPPAAGATALALPGSAPQELELVLHQGAYFARDLSGGRVFKSGSPLGQAWAPLKGGEMLLVSTGALVRFEEP